MIFEELLIGFDPLCLFESYLLNVTYVGDAEVRCQWVSCTGDSRLHGFHARLSYWGRVHWRRTEYPFGVTRRRGKMVGKRASFSPHMDGNIKGLN